MVAVSSIGTLNEKPLHAALKQWYAQPGDRFEVPVGGFIADILREDLIIEIQTGSFAAIRRKLQKLVREHRVRLVYPVAKELWIIKQPCAGFADYSYRKSPKQQGVEALFKELVSFPELLLEPNFSIDVLLTREEQLREFRKNRHRRRRGWRITERRLLAVTGQYHFETPADLAALLPETLPLHFTTADLAIRLGRPRALAMKIAYCLRQSGVISIVGKKGNAFVYERGGR